MKKILSSILLFSLSAALPIIAIAPKTAFSLTTRTVAAQGGCTSVGGPSNAVYSCAGTIGSDFQTGALQGAYFDFFSPTAPPSSVLLTLIKESFSGSVYTDSVSYATSATFHSNDVYVLAVNVKLAPSPWDYLHATMQAMSSLGAIDPIGVAYFNNN